MRPPEALKYLWDVAEACRRVCEFIEGKSIDRYRQDVLLRSAVERQLMIVGEALG